MTAPTWESYVDFRTRAMQRLAALAGGELVQEPELVGLVSPDSGGRGGLVVRAPVPEERFDAVLARGLPQWVALLPAAVALAPTVAARGWDRQEERTAMAMTELGRVPVPSVPAGLEVRPVAVRQGADGYPLVEAVRVALLYGEQTPAAVRDLEIEAQLLRRLSGVSFFAAVASDGSCVGTAGSRVVDGAALVAAVATVPTARRRGIGTALTAVALQAAAQAGATEAYLDATAVGTGIYRRLGFQEIGPVRWCERSDRA